MLLLGGLIIAPHTAYHIHCMLFEAAIFAFSLLSSAPCTNLGSDKTFGAVKREDICRRSAPPCLRSLEVHFRIMGNLSKLLNSTEE